MIKSFFKKLTSDKYTQMFLLYYCLILVGLSLSSYLGLRFIAGFPDPLQEILYRPWLILLLFGLAWYFTIKDVFNYKNPYENKEKEEHKDN